MRSNTVLTLAIFLLTAGCSAKHEANFLMQPTPLGDPIKPEDLMKGAVLGGANAAVIGSSVSGGMWGHNVVGKDLVLCSPKVTQEFLDLSEYRGVTIDQRVIDPKEPEELVRTSRRPGKITYDSNCYVASSDHSGGPEVGLYIPGVLGELVWGAGWSLPAAITGGGIMDKTKIKSNSNINTGNSMTGGAAYGGAGGQGYGGEGGSASSNSSSNAQQSQSQEQHQKQNQRQNQRQKTKIDNSWGWGC